MVRVSGKIRRILLDQGLVSPESWAAAVDSEKPVLEFLLNDESFGGAQFMSAVGSISGVAPVELENCTPEERAMEALSREICTQMCVVPLVRNANTLTVAVSDPFDVLLFDDLSLLSGCRVRPVLSHPAAIRACLEATYDDGSAAVEELLGEVNAGEIEVRSEEEDEVNDLDVEALAAGDDVPAVKLVNLILLRALKDRASDIHIEPGEDTMRVRYRVDGRLTQAMSPPKGLGPSLLSRLKILADLDIAERFKPQDGKFQIRYEGRNIDLRLSTLPVVGGEKAVMRILDAAGVAMSLDSMGLEPRCLDDINEAAGSAHGMLLVTGPTGSGKSTTLYSCVKTVANPEINIVTVEDPVEYKFTGLNQVPVRASAGMTFASALRAFLRQDPDVIMVGEVRDQETAQICMRAALTGHLVLSTLHTNSALQVINRLIDMGVEPFLLGPALRMLEAQRLVRRLCPDCKAAAELPGDVAARHGMQDGQPVFRPVYDRDCSICRGLGFKGRVGLYEVIGMNQELQDLVSRSASEKELREAVTGMGVHLLEDSARLRLAEGVTSLDEVADYIKVDR